MRSSGVRVRLFRFAAILLFFVLACSKKSEPPKPAVQKPAEVRAPAGLIGELTVPDPRRLWTSLRKLGGSRAEALPSSVELALFAALDLPPRVAGYIQPETPLVGVVVAMPNGRQTFVLGVRTVRGAELVNELTTGASPAFSAVRGSPVTVLIGQKPTPVLGAIDDWLLVGLHPDGLQLGGPYLARGLGKKHLPAEPLTFEVGRAALAGPLSAVVKERWAEQRSRLDALFKSERAQQGREPDFADPKALFGLVDGYVSSLLDALASSERLSFSLRPEADRLELSLSVAAVKNGALARSIEALDTGSLDALLELPSSAKAAGLLRTSQAERDAAAEKPADFLRSMLGERLAEKDAAPLADALRSYHRGRGALTVFGLLGEDFFLRQEARDPKELERGLRGILRMLRLPVLAEPLMPLVGKVNLKESTAKVAGIEGPVHRVQVSEARAGSRGFEVLLHTRDSSAWAVVQSKPGNSLAKLTRPEDSTLGKSPLAKLTQGRVPAAYAAYLDLSELPTDQGPAPVLFVLGKKGSSAVLELELSGPACATVAESFGSP
jgi:hypothetical protein